MKTSIELKKSTIPSKESQALFVLKTIPLAFLSFSIIELTAKSFGYFPQSALQIATIFTLALLALFHWFFWFANVPNNVPKLPPLSSAIGVRLVLALLLVVLVIVQIWTNPLGRETPREVEDQISTRTPNNGACNDIYCSPDGPWAD